MVEMNVPSQLCLFCGTPNLVKRDKPVNELVK